MKRGQPVYTGAFGRSVVAFTPQIRRRFEFDVANCPHCGVHHASLDGELVSMGGVESRVIVRCPALQRPIEVIVKLFFYVP